LENRLRNLYELQIVDNSLDELEELKGDLPAETLTLERHLEQAVGQLEQLERTMRDSFTARDSADEQIIGLKEKLEKYKSQQYQVRTNREYDALTREMDAATETIARLEKEMGQHENQATIARAGIDAAKEQVEQLKTQLAEKQVQLEQISKANEEEELRYRHKREKLLVRIKKADVAEYERIRNAKKGKAIVPVRRGACGGCFNTVPPQKLLELRQNKKLYHCERCGRILVSDEIVNSVSAGK
jgi:predicted  nucleic acid-binding Zn-ribbon protein